VATVIYLDTHVAAWLYAGTVELLPPLARRLVEQHELLISPMVALELQYLHEVGRTLTPADPVLEALRRDLALQICDLPFAEVARVALSQSWTRDPFDRLIASAALCRAAPLLTKDALIRANCPRAIWDSDPTGGAAG
jgi:PIN domain nuclease of toxin-antitoxin system